MIEFVDVEKIYKSGSSSVAALKKINLQVAAGEIFGVIGHSGAGKSTLIRLVNRLEQPTRGAVKVSGLDLASLDEHALRKFRQGVGMIFQHFNLLGSMTVAENIAYAMRIVGIPDAQAMDARVDELLELGKVCTNQTRPCLSRT